VFRSRSLAGQGGGANSHNADIVLYHARISKRHDIGDYSLEVELACDVHRVSCCAEVTQIIISSAACTAVDNESTNLFKNSPSWSILIVEFDESKGRAAIG
jgi:hypothetical protein